MKATSAAILVAVGVVAAFAIGVPIQQTMKGRSEGASYGATRTRNSCYHAVLDGKRQCRGISCFFHNRAYYHACMETSKNDGGLCSTMPRGVNLGGLEAWKNRECKRLARDDRSCRQILLYAFQQCRAAKKR